MKKAGEVSLAGNEAKPLPSPAARLGWGKQEWVFPEPVKERTALSCKTSYLHHLIQAHCCCKAMTTQLLHVSPYRGAGRLQTVHCSCLYYMYVGPNHWKVAYFLPCPDRDPDRDPSHGLDPCPGPGPGPGSGPSLGPIPGSCSCPRKSSHAWSHRGGSRILGWRGGDEGG